MRVTSGDATLHVEVSGSGPPLLSVSGSGSALGDGTSAVPAALTERSRVAGFDHRGLGRSTGADRPLTMADFAADGFAVADALGWSEFAVIGVSFGGMVALEMAVSQPDRITALVVACSSSGGAGGSSYPLHERPAPLEALRLADSRPEAWPRLIELMSGRQPSREPAYERQLQARRGHDVWDRLPSVTAPTLVAAGTHDLIAPPVNSQAIASRISGSVYEAFDGGHAFLLQDERAWPRVIDFLSHTSSS